MTDKQEAASSRDPQRVLFVTGERSLAPGEVELHRSKGDEIARSIEEVKEDWNIITTQITELVSSTDNTLETGTGYEMNEIEISLAFSAKGKLAFIAEAGAEASIKIKLKRKQQSAV